MELPDLVKGINKTLIDRYGLNPFNDPNYQIVFSDDAREYRKGKFNDFYGKIFLKSENGVRYVKKYPYIKSKFIIEKWYPSIKFRNSKDLVNTSRGAYEPLYVFEDKDRNYLTPIERVALLVCAADYDPAGFLECKYFMEEYSKKQDKLDNDIIYYGLDITPISLALAIGEGISMTKEIKE